MLVRRAAFLVANNQFRLEFRIDIAFANQFEVSVHVKDTRSAVLKGLRSNLSVPDAINYEERY